MEEKAVLIAGAGPTGLTLANFLAISGVPFLLIDKKKHPSRDSKAFGIQARTLEIFKHLGIADKAIKQGSFDNIIHIFIKNKEAAKFRLHEVTPGESNYPYFLILQQAKTENLLIEALQEKRHNVHWEHELLQFENGEGCVTAVIKNPEGKEYEHKFQYLIGCDGAGSTVRENAGFEFKGKTFSNTFYLADCSLDWKYPHGDIYFMLSNHYVSGIFSFTEKNKYRIFNFMNASVKKEKNEKLSLAEVQKILDDNPHIQIKVDNMDWSSSFKIHRRHTTNFRKGRVLLAGDSAHVHSPAGGQGMNTGIQDAYNLAWKLSLVIQKKAGTGLLQTYNEERYPIARKLHKTTDRLFQFMVLKNRFADFARFHILPLFFKSILSIKPLRKKMLRRFSQIAIKYRFSYLSKSGKGKSFKSHAPKAGDRAPYCKINFNTKAPDIFSLFSYTAFTILIASAEKKKDEYASFIQNLEENLQLTNIEIYYLKDKIFIDTYGVKKSAVFIIRPDGHIGFRSSKICSRDVLGYFYNTIKLVPGGKGKTL